MSHISLEQLKCIWSWAVCTQRGLKVWDGQTRDSPRPCEHTWLHRTIDLDVDEARGDDAVLAVQLDVSRALLVKEEFLWVEDLPLSHPQVLPEGTVTHSPSSSAICGGAHGSVAVAPVTEVASGRTDPASTLQPWALQCLLGQSCSSSSNPSLPGLWPYKIHRNGVFTGCPSEEANERRGEQRGAVVLHTRLVSVRNRAEGTRDGGSAGGESQQLMHWGDLGTVASRFQLSSAARP